MSNTSIKSRAQDFLHSNRLTDAKELYTQACTEDPSDAEAWHMLSAINGMLGEYADSASCALEVIRLIPDAAPAYNNLGAALLSQGKLDEARSAFEKTLRLNPGDHEALNNIGNILARSDDFLQAAEFYNNAIKSKPDYPDAYNNLGNAMLHLQRPVEALDYLQTALQLNPAYLDATFNTAKAQQALGRHHDARNTYERILQSQPEHADAIFGIGELLRDQCDFATAEKYIRHSLEINPDDARALGALAGIRKDCGKINEAIAVYKQAIKIDPDIPGLYSNYLMTLNYIDHPDDLDIPGLHRAWGEKFGKKHKPGFKFTGETQKNMLTIGYVSHDFRTHSVAYFFEPILSNHDHGRFRIICYPTLGKLDEDETTRRIMQKTDLWHDITHLSDKDAAMQIFNDEVDILIDLSGHTAWNRLGIFALRPAPVQMTYIGYPNTTGLSTMDYRIVDAISDPEDHGAYTEKFLRMPHSFLTYLPPATPEIISDSPYSRHGNITFGSFNALQKINHRVIETWISLLGQIDGSRLILKNHSFIDKSVRAHYLELFSRGNIDPGRIELLPFTKATSDHFELFSRVDIALDTFPYNGTTTTCEALWMGVPVITLAGKSHVNRVGLSILHELGLEELAADDPSDYISVAVKLARDTRRLAELRRTLRHRLSSSMLGKNREFTRHLEDLYSKAWDKYAGAH